MDENLSHLKKELSAVKKNGCPEKSLVLMIEVIFLNLELLILWYSHLTLPRMMGLPSEGA
jgi:hypothetical protein